MKTKEITLDCGIVAESWTHDGYQHLDISLINLYNGYGDMNSMSRMASLFKELADKGYEGSGMMRKIGYYDSTDDIILHVVRKI